MAYTISDSVAASIAMTTTKTLGGAKSTRTFSALNVPNFGYWGETATVSGESDNLIVHWINAVTSQLFKPLSDLSTDTLVEFKFGSTIPLEEVS